MPGPARSPRIPAAALWLGLGGLIPFFVLSGGLWLEQGAASGGIAIALVAYGGTILAFLGGVHWGAEMMRNGDPSWGRLVASVLPPLVAWPALVFLPTFGIAIEMLGFVVLLAFDVFLAERGGFPRWYKRLRIVLTSGVVLALGAALARAILI